MRMLLIYLSTTIARFIHLSIFYSMKIACFLMKITRAIGGYREQKTKFMIGCSGIDSSFRLHAFKYAISNAFYIMKKHFVQHGDFRDF